jgi:ABC-type transport system involved in multi-copper enzyme maturation permease subunit
MSPIHDQSYRRYQGERRPVGHAWRVIAADGIRRMLAKRAFMALLLVAWVPFIVRMVQLYIVSNYPQASGVLPVNAEMFRDFLDQQGVFVFFMAIYAGSGLIANDRRANALQIYLSKPMLRMEYIGGKLLVLVSFLLFVTLLPSILLLLMQAAFAGNISFISTNLFLIPAIVLASLVTVTVSSFTMLALSSLSKSSRFVALMYTGAIFFTAAMFNALRVITGSTRVAWISISSNLEQVNDVIFRKAPRFEVPTVICVMVLAALVVLSISVLERRVRGVEVVA